MENKEKKLTMNEVHDSALEWCNANDGAVLLLTYDSKSGTSSLTTHGKTDNQAVSLVGTLMQNPDFYDMIKTSLEITDGMKKHSQKKSSDKVAS